MQSVRLEAFAPNTRCTRASQWKMYENFCKEFALTCYLITVKNTCRFVVWKSTSVSYVTLNNYVSALNVFRKINGEKTDLCDDYAIHLTLRGLRRILGDVSMPVDALLPEDLIKMKLYVNFKVPLEHAVWVGILLAFRTLLRKSHFFVSTDENEHLLPRTEVIWEPRGLRISISRSKIIQFGQRLFEAPVNYCYRPLCASFCSP